MVLRSFSKIECVVLENDSVQLLSYLYIEQDRQNYLVSPELVTDSKF